LFCTPNPLQFVPTVPFSLYCFIPRFSIHNFSSHYFIYVDLLSCCNIFIWKTCIMFLDLALQNKRIVKFGIITIYGKINHWNFNKFIVCYIWAWMLSRFQLFHFSINCYRCSLSSKVHSFTHGRIQTMHLFACLVPWLFLNNMENIFLLG